jgi:glutamyl-tRNA synthetase
MPPSVRFAPSPTGRLHVGNVRTAILNWLFAHRHGGTFWLSLDDTDVQRSTEAFAEGIREDLQWLGLKWDREERQSARLARYAAAADELKAKGRLYPCYETEDELERKRRRQRARGLPPIYDRAGLKLDDAGRAKLEQDGRRPHWRFRLDNAEEGSSGPLPTIVSWNDLIRGEEHVTNPGVQIGLFEALGFEPPAFGHHSLLVDADGHALSKRLGALSIEKIREEGIEPMAVASYTSLIGTSDAIEAHESLDDLARLFALEKISTAPARFDPGELKNLNARLLHKLPYEAVAERLVALGLPCGPSFWTAVRGNIAVLEDVATWWRVVDGELAPRIEDEAFCAEAGKLLPAEPWDDTTWDVWISALKAATGRKGRALFHPLRLALTGLEDGPELKTLLPLIGRTKAEARLRGEVA